MLSLAGDLPCLFDGRRIGSHQVIEPEFVALEKAEAIRDANRVLAAMNAEVEHLSDLDKSLGHPYRQGY